MSVMLGGVSSSRHSTKVGSAWGDEIVRAKVKEFPLSLCSNGRRVGEPWLRENPALSLRGELLPLAA